MNESWRDVVAELAGADAEMAQSVAPEWDNGVVAELVIPGAAFRIPGVDEDDAWRKLAHGLGDFRLVQALEAASWVVVEEVIDETTYVVARDPDGILWAIGVAAADGDRRWYIESDMEYDDRAFDRIAFIEPLDTRDAETVLAALKAVE